MNFCSRGTKHVLYFSYGNYMNFAINNTFNLNYVVKYKSVKTIQKRVNVYLKVNQSIVHMRPAGVREPREVLQSTFDLIFC